MAKRRRLTREQIDDLRQLRAKGFGWDACSKIIGVAKGTLYDYRETLDRQRAEALIRARREFDPPRVWLAAMFRSRQASA